MQRTATLTLILAFTASAGTALAAEITVPEGFTASVFHEGLGAQTRHIAVRANGDVFVSRRTGELVALRDTNGDGTADQVERRKLRIKTGLEIHNPFLYFSDDTTVSRVMLRSIRPSR